MKDYIVKFNETDDLYKAQVDSTLDLLKLCYEYNNYKLSTLNIKMFGVCDNLEEQMQFYNDLDNENNPISLIIEDNQLIWIDKNVLYPITKR